VNVLPGGCLSGVNVATELVGRTGRGASALCVGPTLSGKWEFLLDLLEAGTDAGHVGLFVTTDAGAVDLRRRRPAAFPAGRSAIVDCTSGSRTSVDADTVVRSVGSPADLTGIAVAVSKVLEPLDHSGPVVVGLDSLTTLSLYTEFSRLFRFYHSFVEQMTDRGGVVATSVDDGTLSPEAVGRFESVTGSRVEFHDGTGRRLVEVGDEPGEWRRPGTDAETTPETDRAATTPSGSVGSTTPEGSLAGLIRGVLSDRPTLTVANVASGTAAPLLSYARRLALRTRTVGFGGGQPAGVAMLHDGPDLLATATVPALVDSLEATFGNTDAETALSAPADTDAGAFLEAVPQGLFATRAATRPRLLRASRTVERRAVDQGVGTIHAGFQAYSRLLRDPDTVRVYERLLAAGLEVHLYGEPDADLSSRGLDGAYVHGLPAAEVDEAWFVVFDGGDTPTAGGSLVTLETDPDRYDGYWSYDPDVVDRSLADLRERYAAV
jgi:KaiC/GvpD/RAD55 family RecA-like ATPase